MATPFIVKVFGKAGCDKCHTLNQRLDRILNKKDWPDFEKVPMDVETEEGIIAFCEAECLNPQSVPAMLVCRWNEETGEYEPLSNRTPGVFDEVCKSSRLYQHLGLQTDYGKQGRGVISPKMLLTVLGEARESDS